MNKPYVVRDFLTEEENNIIESFLDRTSKPSPISYNHRAALGFQTYQEAASVTPGTNAMLDNDYELSKRTEEDLEAIYLLSYVYDRAKRILEEFYGRELALVQANYIEYSAGPGQELHSDMYNSEDDDSDVRDDGFAHMMRCAAVVHLATGGGVDFTGGDLWFPQQNYRLTPEKASLVYFVGDRDHMHQVEDLESGKRKSISLFFGYKEEVL
jgi:hypothetical protein